MTPAESRLREAVENGYPHHTLTIEDGRELVAEFDRLRERQFNADMCIDAVTEARRVLREHFGGNLAFLDDDLVRGVIKMKEEFDRLTRERNEAQTGRAPHYCAMDHAPIRHWDSEIELCPLCRIRDERDEARADRDAMAKALTFYAKREHFILSDDRAWDTVSGEPPNWWCDEAGTATVEDGSIARFVLAGELVDLEDDAQAEDAARYRLVRRGQHWSVINGIGDQLRADALDAAIDAQIEQERSEQAKEG